MSATVETNGAAPCTAEAKFPMETFREAAVELRRPFTAMALKWKVQAMWPKAQQPTGGLIVCYIDRGLVIDRLNVVVPDLWFPQFQDLGSGQMICRLTVDSILREDVGEGSTLKARYSDSLKRAAVQFGIGVSLSRVPQSMLTTESGRVKARGANGNWSLDITQGGLDYLRLRYQTWLDTIGEATFGKPLDHGDTGEAQGDDEPDGQLVDGETKVELYTRLTSNTTLRKQRGLLAASGVTGLALEPRPQDIEAAVSALSEEQGDTLRKLLDAAAENTGAGDEC